MLRKFYYLFLTVALLGGAACSSSDSDDSDPTPPEGETVLVGQISDATTGKGIAGVPVTDGYTFTTTDADGNYRLVANRYCRNVYYVTPANYKVALDPSSKLPLFYSTSTIQRYKENRNDFKLEPLPAVEENFTLVAIGDPQCKTDDDVTRWETETIPDIKSTLKSAQEKGRWTNAYAVTLGDITFDNTVQWDPMKKSMSNMQIGTDYLPIFNCMGNHDHDASQSTPYAAQLNYVQRFGPADYSFNRGKAHIVVMDNVVCTRSTGSTWNYEAGLLDQQYNWLKADLDLVENKADKIIFFCAHIPFRNGGKNTGSNVNEDKHYADVLNLLTQFKEAHIMIGHTHYPQNYIHTKYVCQGGKPVYEHVHGGACGAWWSSNLNVDGAPNGYSIYEIKGNVVDNWVAKSTGRPETYQMRVYDGNATYTGSKEYSYTWTGGGTGAGIKTNGNAALKDCFVVSIWNDDPQNWKVELVQNGVVTPMSRISSNIADMCAVSFFFNECGKTTTTWNKALQHYWYVKAPGGNPSTEKDWVVRATQTIPASGKTKVYEAAAFQTDFSGFAAN